MVRRLTLYRESWVPRVGLILCGVILATHSATAAVPPHSAEDIDDTAVVRTVTTEVIREHYPNEDLKIERHVAQDPQGNYANHGP
jgi:hypothetical protein